jgi:penicillin-binding protein 1A
MTNVHGISVAGGTFPAEIWHDYMNVAHGSSCDSFPPPQNPPHFTTFNGKHSANGSSRNGYYYGSGTGAPTTGGNGSYPPSLYASPPQVPQNSPAQPNPGGNPNGGGNGGGNGNGNPGGPNGNGTGGGVGPPHP